MASLIDTHCHLDIIAEQGQSIPISLKNAAQAGVQKILQIGIDEQSSLLAKDISEQTEIPGIEIFFSIGCHPTETHEFPKSDSILNFAKQNLGNPKLSAIGEIGIDLYHTKETKEQQRKTFSEFLEFAGNHSLPVVIHSRDGFEDTYEVLKEFPKCFGVIHCFTYNYEKAKQFIDLGYFISFSGIVAFKSATDIQDAASKIPLETVLIETDAPFLAPPPHRGKRNEPSYVPYVLEKMYSLRKEGNAEIEKQIYNNSLKFLNRKAYHHA